MRAGLISLALILLLGCTHTPESQGLHVSRDTGLAEPKLQYLGVGGWLMHWRGEGFVIGPSFSNPATLGLLGLPPITVRPNEPRIDRYMPLAPDVTMLLVGHAHYDHLLDVPRVMQIQTPNAKVYGSETVGHILRASRSDRDPRPLVDPRRIVVPADDQIAPVGVPDYRGTWFYSSGERLQDGDDPARLPNGRPKGTIRAMPVASMHAGHILRHNFLPGAYDNDLEEAPTYIWDWKLGHHTLAWIIDLLGPDGLPVYRIHFQDSAARPPFGFPPVLADRKGFDLEILCAASWNQVDYYPGGLLRVTRPRLVVLGHWENFFGNDPGQHARTIPLLRYDGLIENIRRAGYGSRYKVLEPLTEIALPGVE